MKIAAWTVRDEREAGLEHWRLAVRDGQPVIADLTDPREDGTAREWVRLFASLGCVTHAKALELAGQGA